MLRLRSFWKPTQAHTDPALSQIQCSQTLCSGLGRTQRSIIVCGIASQTEQGGPKLLTAFIDLLGEKMAVVSGEGGLGKSAQTPPPQQLKGEVEVLGQNRVICRRAL